MEHDKRKAVLNVLRHHRQYPDIHALIVALCAASHKSINSIGKMHLEPSSIRPGGRYLYALAQKLWEENPFDLPKEGKDGALAEKALFSKTREGVHWTKDRLKERRDEVVARVKKAARNGARLRLPDALKQLFPEEIYHYNNIDCGVVPARRVANFFHRIKPHRDELAALLQVAGITDSRVVDDFAALPAGPQTRKNKFTKSLKRIVESLSL